MDIHTALRSAAKAAGWTPTKIAAEAGVREMQAIRWLSGSVNPRLAQYQRLRATLPGFAALMDDGEVAA